MTYPITLTSGETIYVDDFEWLADRTPEEIDMRPAYPDVLTALYCTSARGDKIAKRVEALEWVYDRANGDEDVCGAAWKAFCDERSPGEIRAALR